VVCVCLEGEAAEEELPHGRVFQECEDQLAVAVEAGRAVHDGHHAVRAPRSIAVNAPSRFRDDARIGAERARRHVRVTHVRTFGRQSETARTQVVHPNMRLVTQIAVPGDDRIPDEFDEASARRWRRFERGTRESKELRGAVIGFGLAIELEGMRPGGEPAALCVLDAVVRLLPGALSDHESASSDSHYDGVLSPPSFRFPLF